MYFYYFISNQWQIRDLNFLLASFKLINVHIVIVVLADLKLGDIENKSIKTINIPKSSKVTGLIIPIFYFFCIASYSVIVVKNA